MRALRRWSLLFVLALLVGCRASCVGDEPLRQYPQSPSEDHAGGRWFRTAFDGWLRYADGRFTRFTTADGMPCDTLCGVHEDEHGALWFVVEGAGAVRWDGERQVAVTTAAGRCSDHIECVVRDGRSSLWFVR
ncbi:MAG: hypothetical protein KAI24_24390 [Planctomycetes bacterium]|nr:hypothetical protein [Planctomycetota bacterium]